MKPKHQRLILIMMGLACLGLASFMVLNHFNTQLIFYYSPSQLNETSIPDGTTIRIGGLVKEHSIKHDASGMISFVVSDGNAEKTIHYKGLLPSLFREKQGMVALGTLQPDGSMLASELLAKHDENYMPPEVVDSLKRTGHWKQ